MGIIAIFPAHQHCKWGLKVNVLRSNQKTQSFNDNTWFKWQGFVNRRMVLNTTYTLALFITHVLHLSLK